MLTLLAAILGIMITAFALGLYVAVTMGLTALTVGAIFSDRPVWDMLTYIPWNTTTTLTLIALPLFILMGEILLRSGVTERMYETLAKWLNFLPGSLLHTNVVASGLFACISGSSAATAATIGGVAMPFMRSKGYDRRLTLGSLAAGGTLGILIPPSIVMIVYGVIASVSIGKLYIAGIIPGLFLMLAFLVVIGVSAKLKPEAAPKEPPSSWKEKFTSLLGLAPVLALIGVVLGTIYMGVATATEAAAFGVTGAFLLALVYRRINKQMLRETFLATATTTAMIMFILVGAFLLQFVVAFLGLPSAMTKYVISLNLTGLEVVLIICVLYLVLGMFMESLSMVVVTIPVLLPVLQTLGVDLIWFGVIVVILVETALVTPPMGLNLFILQGLTRTEGDKGTHSIEVFMGVLPFLIALMLILGLIIAYPQIATWLVYTS